MEARRISLRLQGRLRETSCWNTALKLERGHEAALHEIITALRESVGAVTSSLDAGHLPAEPDIGARLPRCVICCLAERSAERSLRAFFTEFVNDPQVRTRFRKARGYCREHTPLLAECGDALGVAILYADLADETRQRWRSRPGSPKQKLLSRWFVTSKEFACPACTAEAEAEQRLTAALALG